MKTINTLFTILFLSALTISCSSDDDGTPEIVNEEEIITTLTVTLTPDNGGAQVTWQTRDLDGDGPNPPVITISGDLTNNTTYQGSISLLNETEDPAGNITEEVEEEAEEHQFFYTTGGGLDLTTAYANFDSDGNPLGTEFVLTTGEASSGTITFTLRHEPTKPNTGLNDAGGETDISAPFSVTIQ